MDTDLIAESACGFAELNVPGPTPTRESQPFWEGLRQRRYLLLRCARCAAYQPYAVAMCRACWGLDVHWVDAAGTATVVSWTLVHRPGHPSWAPAAPYLIGVVRLAEGVTVLTQLLPGDGEPRLGQPCDVTFVDIGEWTLPFFSLRRESRGGE